MWVLLCSDQCRPKFTCGTESNDACRYLFLSWITCKNMRWSETKKDRTFEIMILPKRSWDSSVGIVMGYGLKDRRSIPGRSKNFSLLHSVQTCSGAHPASYPMGTGALSPGVKGPGREAGHSPPSSAKAKSSGAIPPLPNRSSWRGA
jgi:hypothetical protein